jgi:hypothetical protein
VDAVSPTTKEFSSFHWRRLGLWLAISLIVSFVCCVGDGTWGLYKIKYGITNVAFHPLDEIFFSSGYVSVLTSVYIFHTPYVVFGRALWIFFGVAMSIAALTHLLFFLTSRRLVFYALVAIQIFALAAGEAGKIAMITSAPVVLPIHPASVEK